MDELNAIICPPIIAQSAPSALNTPRLVGIRQNHDLDDPRCRGDRAADFSLS